MQTITLSAHGKDYALNPIGTNAFCDLEERTGKSFGVMLSEIGALGIEQMRLSTVRMFLGVCMEAPASDTDIGDLIDAVGFEGIATAINGLIIPAREVHG